MSSFEEKYRKRNSEGTATITAAPPPPTEAPQSDAEIPEADKDREYKAYHTSAHPEFELWVRVSDANKNAQVSLPYSYRNHMVTDGEGFIISMHFSTPVICVSLHGRNLEDLFRKLLKHEVEWVMEYDPRKFDAVPEDASCITAIEITRKPLPEEPADGQLSGEKNGTPNTTRH